MATIYPTTKNTEANLNAICNTKGFTIDTLYLLLFMLIILIGSVLGYIYYLKEKKEQLDTIKRGFCPLCHQKSIIITDERSAGCGPKIVSFKCTGCDYENAFSIENGSCGI